MIFSKKNYYLYLYKKIIYIFIHHFLIRVEKYEDMILITAQSVQYSKVILGKHCNRFAFDCDTHSLIQSESFAFFFISIIKFASKNRNLKCII